MQRTRFNDGWSYRPKTAGFAEQHAGLGGDWTAVTLPHDAMIGTVRSPSARPANVFFPGGTWEYRRSIDVPPDWSGDVVLLRFEGVYRDAVVSVNGSVAAHRPYGYSTFDVPVDHLLRPGEDNEVRVEARAGDDSRWYSGAGIHRNVWLLRSGRVHLVPDELFVDASEVDGACATVVVAAAVRNVSSTTSAAAVRVELLGDDGSIVAADEAPITTFPGDTATVRRRLFVEPAHRWQLDDPHLYVCRVMLLDGSEVIDADESTFGIRSLSVDPRRGFLVNDEPILLRGACVHHDNGPIGAASIERAEERRVQLLKDAGFNAIRSAHNPMSQAMLAACDRIGVLVMDETFDMWHQPKSTDDYATSFADWWEADVESFVRNGRNHPSVVMYSIGNEIPDGSTSAGLRVGRAMAEKVRSLDSSRFVTQGINGLFAAGADAFVELRRVAAEGGEAMDLEGLMAKVAASDLVGERTAEACSHLDVAGYNYMDARFDGDGARYPNRVVVSTESYPPSIAKEWAGVVRNPQVIGEFTWTGWDYLGEVGIGRIEHGDKATALGMNVFEGAYPWLAAWCGDVDITGHRRPQSYYREIVFGLRTDPYLAVHRPEHHGLEVVHATPWAFPDVVETWTWPGQEGSPLTVDVYADADEVELFVNDRSLGRCPTGPEHDFRAEFETTFEPGVLEAIAWRDGVEVGRASLRSATGPLRLAATVDRDQVVGEPTDLAHVAVSLVDDEGAVWTGADRPVEVTVEGPAVLQGLASANPQSEDPFTGTICTTYEGRALAVVRPTGQGTINVIVSARDCADCRVEIHAE